MDNRNNDDNSNDGGDADVRMMGGGYETPVKPKEVSLPSTHQHDNQLEVIGNWLLGIPRDDVSYLRDSPEYKNFLEAFAELGNAHQTIVSANRTWLALGDSAMSPASYDSSCTATRNLSSEFSSFESFNPQSSPDKSVSTLGSPSSPSRRNSFLQNFAADDLLVRILEFLECRSLISVSRTCSRMQKMAHLTALQKTYDFSTSRQLPSVMELLRAKEQIDGVDVEQNNSHVQIPVLLLPRRIRVTNAGDPEYNGYYYCTGVNGNGYTFTKPRFSGNRRVTPAPGPQPQPQTHRLRVRVQTLIPNGGRGRGIMNFSRLAVNIRREGTASAGEQHEPTVQDDSSSASRSLRCIIAKRFSSTTILWYMSKEQSVGTGAEPVTQAFTYFSKLLTVDDATPDVCRYPSASSILSRHGDGWQSLASAQTLNPPTVELL